MSKLDQPGQQAPYVFSHRSDQKAGYRQLSVRIFWPILRYVFKNSARYIYIYTWFSANRATKRCQSLELIGNLMALVP